MIESNIYLEMILHTNLDLTAVSIFYPPKSKNLHCLGVVTPPDLSIFCNIGVVTPPDRRSSATLGGDTLACSPFMRTLMCAPGVPARP